MTGKRYNPRPRFLYATKCVTKWSRFAKILSHPRFFKTRLTPAELTDEEIKSDMELRSVFAGNERERCSVID